MASSDGRWLAYLREEHGRNSIWLRALDQPESRDRRLTPTEIERDGDVVFAEWLAYLLCRIERGASSGSSSWTRLDLSVRWTQMKLDTRLSLRTAAGWPSANYRAAIGICGYETCITVRPADLLMRTATTQSQPGRRTRRRWFMPATAGEPCGFPRSAVDASPNSLLSDPTCQDEGHTRARISPDIVDEACNINERECLQNVTDLSFDDMNQ